MRRVILDTNIYGRMIERKEADELGIRIESRKDIVIYGFDVVRKELRATSMHSTVKRSKFRLALLGIYDRVTQRHNLSTTTLITQLAEDYYNAYSRIGGRISRVDIINDFLIVSCAAVHDLDIVVSDDNDSMREDHALTAYEVVNKIKRLRMPQFIGYDAFGRLLA